MYEKIKEICKQKNISINKLEQDLGFAKGYMSKLNVSSPSLNNAKKIADYLEIGIDELIQ